MYSEYCLVWVNMTHNQMNQQCEMAAEKKANAISIYINKSTTRWLRIGRNNCDWRMANKQGFKPQRVRFRKTIGGKHAESKNDLGEE